jgi:hypothetical protein
VPVGTTTVENLLRVARSDAAAGTAFAALYAGGPRHIISVPPAGSAEGLSAEELAELVQQASTDPEFFQARVFVRSVQMGRTLTLAVAPLRDAVGQNMIGLVAERDHKFEAPQLEVLERLAERLVRHLEVVQHMNGAGADRAEPGVDGDAEPAGGTPDTDWDDEWRRGQLPRSDVWSGAVVSVHAAHTAPAQRAAPEIDGSPEVPSARRHSVPPSPPVSAAMEEQAPAQARAARSPAPEEPALPTSPWWAERDELTGLPSVGQFFSRAGRLLAPDGRPDGRGAGAFALVVVEVPEERTTPIAAGVLTKELRFTDPVARIDRCLLAAALVLFPSRTGDAVEQRLVGAVRAGVDHPAEVRGAHVVAEPGDRRDVDELLREAVSRL